MIEKIKNVRTSAEKKKDISLLVFKVIFWHDDAFVMSKLVSLL